MSFENAVEMDNNSTDAEYVPDEYDEESETESVTKPRVNTNKQKEIDVGPSDSEGINPDNICNYISKVQRRSKIWASFSPVDIVRRIARCNICEKQLNYTNISNLKKHLIKIHNKSSLNGEEDPFESVVKSPVKSITPRRISVVVKPHSFRRLKSVLWKYYDIVDEANKTARCRICGKNFCYNFLSNLKKHLIRKHETQPKEGSSDEEGPAEMTEEESSAVWSYFKCLSKDLKLASCLICMKRVDYNDEQDLHKHMGRKHPNAYADFKSSFKKTKKVMITSNGDMYEIEDEVPKREIAAEQNYNDYSDDNNHEMDALATPEYLEEDIFNESRNVPTKKRKITVKQTPTSIKDNNRYVKINNQKSNTKVEENTLDIFGKYIAALLKNLPKYKSDQLQVDFIKLIMVAQTSDSRNINTPINIISSRNSVDNGVSSNSDVQRVITSDGEIEQIVVGNEQDIVSTPAE